MEQEILHTAIDNLKKITGIQAIYRQLGPLDGDLQIVLNGRKQRFTVEVKRDLRIHQLSQIEAFFNRYENFLLVVYHIFPNIKEELRQRGIPYLEANGNMFLKKDSMFLYVDTQKPLDLEKNKGNRAFTKTGLKVLFYLLQHKDAIHLTQRELAKKAQVGLGNIPQVIEGLKETGYLMPLNNKTYVWENRKALLDRWMAEYSSVLRPKLLKDRYELKGDWQELVFNNHNTVWGGEPAADLLTNHLRPEKFILFTKEKRGDLIKNYKLMPDNNGDVEVLEMFWKQANGNTAPPLLVYADLMLEGGKRNKETAEIIYYEYIQPNL